MSAAAPTAAGPGQAPVLCVVGARPNFMKMAPILRAFAAHRPPIPALLVHTGQHYDAEMNQRLFDDLQLPRPDVNLDVGSGTHAVQTAEVMKRFEPVLDARRPACVVVVGDVNSTLACTLVAVKKQVPVVHIEAGLRSGDRGMPEEINRVLTDQVAERLYTTERSAHAHLQREGVADERIVFAGNVMIDSLQQHRSAARAPAATLRAHGLAPALLDHRHGWGLVTLHRPANVDDPATLAALLETLAQVALRLPLVFAMHPRTRAQIEPAEQQRGTRPCRQRGAPARLAAQQSRQQRFHPEHRQHRQHHDQQGGAPGGLAFQPGRESVKQHQGQDQRRLDPGGELDDLTRQPVDRPVANQRNDEHQEVRGQQGAQPDALIAKVRNDENGRA